MSVELCKPDPKHSGYFICPTQHITHNVDIEYSSDISDESIQLHRSYMAEPLVLDKLNEHLLTFIKALGYDVIFKVFEDKSNFSVVVKTNIISEGGELDTNIS